MPEIDAKAMRSVAVCVSQILDDASDLQDADQLARALETAVQLLMAVARGQK